MCIHWLNNNNIQNTTTLEFSCVQNDELTQSGSFFCLQKFTLYNGSLEFSCTAKYLIFSREQMVGVWFVWFSPRPELTAEQLSADEGGNQE